jgi:outer membrane cobalamin receptor
MLSSLGPALLLTSDNPKFLKMLWLCSILIGGFSTSHAVVADDLDKIDEITVTATRKKATKRDVASAVTVITGSELRAGLPQVAMESLRAQPGTYFQQTTPGQGIAIIRGLKGSQVLHLVDGMRLNNAFFAMHQISTLVLSMSWVTVESK